MITLVTSPYVYQLALQPEHIASFFNISKTKKANKKHPVMKSSLLKSLFTALFVLILSLGAVCQPPPPPDEFGEEDNQPAPIGSGLFLLIAMGAAYGGKKVYDARKKLND